MLAVLKTGGKQYVVKPGQTLNVEKLPAELGSMLTLGDVLLVAPSDDGENLALGTGPSVGTVMATVLEQGRADKIRVVKFKPKVRYRRTRGHRQWFTRIRIERIENRPLENRS